jgi:hypothetical protein
MLESALEGLLGSFADFSQLTRLRRLYVADRGIWLSIVDIRIPSTISSPRSSSVCKSQQRSSQSRGRGEKYGRPEPSKIKLAVLSKLSDGLPESLSGDWKQLFRRSSRCNGEASSELDRWNSWTSALRMSIHPDCFRLNVDFPSAIQEFRQLWVMITLYRACRAPEMLTRCILYHSETREHLELTIRRPRASFSFTTSSNYNHKPLVTMSADMPKMSDLSPTNKLNLRGLS